MKCIGCGGLIHMLIIFSSLTFSFQSIISQEISNDFLNNIDWLEKSEIKNWEKQLNEIKVAEDLLSKSNEKFLEIGNIESNSELDEKKKLKKIKNLEKEALDLSEKSVLKYKDIYNNLHNIIIKKLDDKDKQHPAYEEFVELSGKANAAYNEAKKLELTEKTDKLAQANEYQLKSIEKGINIFTTDITSYSTEVLDEPIMQTSEDDVVLDKELLEKYQRYLNDPSMPNPITASELMGMEGDEATFGAFEQLWEDYKMGELDHQLQEKQLAEVASQDTILQQKQGLSESDINIRDSLIADNYNNRQESQDTYVSDDEQVNDEDDKSSITKDAVDLSKVSSDIIPDSDKLYDFRVQVAASRTPLNMHQLQAIYKGGRALVEIKEENYYKYQVRGNNLLSDAQKICSQSGVNNAYIEAYDNLKRVSLGKAAEENRSIEDIVARKGKDRAFRQIDFSVQIAASKIRLNKDKISELYKCTETISIVFENGLYKYQVYIGKNLDNAFRILEQCCQEKAFIVAYKNGRKILLKKAMQEYKNYTP